MRLSMLCARITGLGLCLAAGAGLAAPVGQDLATRAAQGWLRRIPAPLDQAMPAVIDSVQSHTDAAGKVLFHEVKLAPEGFLILAGDDELEPVVAFSDRGGLNPDPESHLMLMLNRDLRTRIGRLQGERGRTATLTAGSARNLGRWQALAYDQVSTADASVPSVSDLRVAPLVASMWDQAMDIPVYNYYTPNHEVCGCVATAMAQLMRFHTFPTAGIGVHSFACTVDGTARTLSTRGGDGSGGPYSWTNMPLVPNSDITTTPAQQIGSLCYDAAVSVKMSFSRTGSGAYLSDATTSLRSIFKYANAIYGNVGGGELVGHGLVERVQPNLDAGLPVILGISGTAGGHAIVCDGYGYTGGTLYHHLNMGWSGYDNAWYQLPDIDSSPAFDLIDDCAYNIFPSGTGELLSGRITDAGGTPVAGVSVTDGTRTATTDSKGIYALKGLSAGTTTITASQSGHTFPQAVRVMGTSSDGAAVGNAYAVDLVRDGGTTPVIWPSPADVEIKLGGSTTFTAGAIGQGPLHFQWSKGGSTVGSDSPVYTLTGAAESDDQASIAVRVTGSHGQADSAPATLSVVRLFNGGFERGTEGWTIFQDYNLALPDGAYTIVSPHTGKAWLCLGDWSSSNVTDFASQSVDLPAQGQISLGFWMGIGNTGTPGSTGNSFRLLVQDGGGQTLATLATANNTQAELGTDGKVVWKPYGPLDLTAYAGRTVVIRLESTQPGGSGTGTVFAIDDLKLTVDAAGARAAVTPSTWVMPAGGLAPLAATVTGSTSDNHVDWTVTGTSGSFNPTRTAGDGSTTVFTAGATPGAYTVTATPVETPGYAGTASVTVVDPANVAVAITASTANVAVNIPVTLTGSVSQLSDASVTWTCSGGTFTGTPGATATWSAATAGSYTVTATSHAAPTRSASKVINVVDPAALSLALNPATATILAPGASATFTASGDLGYGVAWSMTPTYAHADSGLSTVITAPATAPLATQTFTLTAASLLDATKTAAVQVVFKGMDLNADQKLDARDLLSFAAEWGKGAASPANFKGAGTVDDTDLAALLNQIK